MEGIIRQVEGMDAGELDRLQAAIEGRRAALSGERSSAGGATSVVLERRGHGQGVLQLETRAHQRKDGTVTERGPYWYYHYREGGRQRTVYVGKTDEPEERLAERL